MPPRKRQHGEKLVEELRQRHADLIAREQRVDMDLLAVRVRRFRVQRKLTQEQLADRANLAIGTVRKIEQGRAGDVTVGTVRALSYGLDIDPDALFRRKK